MRSLNPFAWFRRRPRLELVAREREAIWPTQEKIPPAESDRLRAAAELRRAFAQVKYDEARAIRTGDIAPLRVVRKSTEQG
jgi:hypothetical protein